MAPLGSRHDAITDSHTKTFLPEFIVALLLIKAKPRRLPPRDFLLQLQSCIRDEPPPIDHQAAKNHVDTIAYWRNAYIKSEETQVQLRARIAELERGEEGLNRTSARTLASTKSTRKRRRDSVEIAEASSHGSQKKQANTRTISAIRSAKNEWRLVSMNEAAILDDHLRKKTFVTEGFEGSAHRLSYPLIHYLYLLQEVLAQEDPDSKQLVTAVCNASAGICQVLSAMHRFDDPQGARPPTVSNSGTIRDSYGAAPTSKTLEDNVDSTLLAIRRAFPCLLEGLDRTHDRSGGPQLEGQVIWDLIKIFDNIVECICNISAVPASLGANTARRSKISTRTQQPVIATSNETQSQSRPNTRSPCLACRERHRKCDGRVPTCRNCEYWKVQCKPVGHRSSNNATSSNTTIFTCPPSAALKLCELAITMMRSLDTTQASHLEVLEGFLFLLLRRVGQGLKHFVFETVEDCITREQEVNSIESNRRANLGHKTATSQQVTETQAPCLIWLLEQAKSFTTTLNQPAHPGYPSNNALGRATVTSSTTSSNTLSTIAHHRLQHTLLTAVFGDQTRADFQAALAPPTPPIDEKMSAKFSEGIKAEGVKDWFKHEVWRIVGWDALRKHTVGRG